MSSSIPDSLTCELNSTTLLVLVCSSTGQGEVPKNARNFVARCNQLEKVPFFMLCLGDSNYASFMGGPKTLFNALSKCTMIHPAVFADDNDKNDFADKTDAFIGKEFSWKNLHFF